MLLGCLIDCGLSCPTMAVCKLERLKTSTQSMKMSASPSSPEDMSVGTFFELLIDVQRSHHTQVGKPAYLRKVARCESGSKLACSILPQVLIQLLLQHLP